MRMLRTLPEKKNNSVVFQSFCSDKNIFHLLRGTHQKKQNQWFEKELNQNGSCGGGRMGFETMIITILIFTIIVRNYNLYYNKRKKNRIT